MSSHAEENQPWERRASESPKAYAAFEAFLAMDEERTLVALKRALGKSYSLIRRWAHRHDWQERARSWDLQLHRERAEDVGRQRRELRRQQLRDADRLKRLALAKLTSLVRRDEVTGELALDPAFSARDAIVLYREILRQEQHLLAMPESSNDETLHREMASMSNQELEEALIFLADVKQVVQEKEAERSIRDDKANQHRNQGEKDDSETGDLAG
jgi:hypothetical protein